MAFDVVVENALGFHCDGLTYLACQCNRLVAFDVIVGGGGVACGNSAFLVCFDPVANDLVHLQLVIIMSQPQWFASLECVKLPAFHA